MRVFAMMAAGFVLFHLMPAAAASSPEAWEKLGQKTDTACLCASNLNEAKVVWKDLYFSQHTAALIVGRYPQPHMKNQQGAVMCLYNKTTGKAEVTEFDNNLLK